MPRFQVDDRVKLPGESTRCGTVKEILDESDPAVYQISWDEGDGQPRTVGRRAEHELIPCPGSHTDR
jgi:hypothetical protein